MTTFQRTNQTKASMRKAYDLLLQVRCAALNSKLGSSFGQLFDTEADPVTDLALADCPQSLDAPNSQT
jgi:hypothetical protein